MGMIVWVVRDFVHTNLTVRYAFSGPLGAFSVVCICRPISMTHLPFLFSHLFYRTATCACFLHPHSPRLHVAALYPRSSIPHHPSCSKPRSTRAVICPTHCWEESLYAGTGCDWKDVSVFCALRVSLYVKSHVSHFLSTFSVVCMVCSIAI